MIDVSDPFPYQEHSPVVAEKIPAICHRCQGVFSPAKLKKHTIESKTIRAFWLCKNCSKYWMTD